MNHQACAGTQTSKGQKVDEIEKIANGTFVPTDMEENSTTEPMVILNIKVRDASSRNIRLGSAAYDTIRTHTVVTITETKTTESEMKI